MNLAYAGIPSGALTASLVDQHLRSLFSKVLDAHEKITYLASHSLGRPLDASFTNIARGATAWAEQLDAAWANEHWLGEALKFRSLIGRLLGLEDPSAVVLKTSAGQGLRAVLNSFPVDKVINVVATRGEFDSADFILKAYLEAGRVNVRWVEPGSHEGPVHLFDAGDVLAAIDNDTDFVAVSSVMFGTGQILKDMDLIIGKAHQHGALVLVDTYHSLGVFPFSMRDLGADFCVGGCYKYLRGGPGRMLPCRRAAHFGIRPEDARHGLVCQKRYVYLPKTGFCGARRRWRCVA